MASSLGVGQRKREERSTCAGLRSSILGGAGGWAGLTVGTRRHTDPSPGSCTGAGEAVPSETQPPSGAQGEKRSSQDGLKGCSLADSELSQLRGRASTLSIHLGAASLGLCIFVFS